MQLSVLFYPQEKQNVNHSFFGSNVWVAGSIEKRLDIDIPQAKVKKVTVE